MLAAGELDVWLTYFSTPGRPSGFIQLVGFQLVGFSQSWHPEWKDSRSVRRLRYWQKADLPRLALFRAPDIGPVR